MHDAGEVLAALDQIVVLGGGAGDTGGIRLLESVIADEMGRHLAGEADDGDTVHQRIDQPGHRVGRARAGGDQHHPHLAGGAGIAFRGVDRGLFVADEDVADGVLLEERVIDGEDGAARIAENDLHPLILEGFEEDFRARPHLAHRPTLSCNAHSSARRKGVFPLGPPHASRQPANARR